MQTGDWTTRGFATLRIANMRTSQVCGLDKSLTGPLADYATQTGQLMPLPTHQQL